jgi:hypothetical protein
VIALYAITDHPTPPLPGLGAVQAVASGDLAAVLGPVVTGEVTVDALWQHERIVEALMDGRDVLPVRYGTCVPDEAAAALESVRGAVELAVRVFRAGNSRPAPTPSPEATTGTDYLRARVRAAAEESDATAIVHEPLARGARAEKVARVNRPGELLRAAYLVDRSAARAFPARVAEIQQDSPQLRITCTGPWPPYSFAGR